ncbi:prenyltransferase/squalene oxidase repeat-containing protein [Aquisphaera insulae]|uniref:prenyltransferase/squalene oxidase repeat-containing protein n=1 Tax=Aquisphaera insulae TaxID=2712864 RepID=UPI0013EA3B0F|nr:prenyltransferase/squalene oxidase repeat-containing protein [Aquisphaera insulae]
MSPQSTSRREFLERGLAAAGVAGLGWSLADPAASAAAPQQPAGPASSAAAPLVERAVAFLRPRQDAKGGWSTEREPGITALVTAGLLRSGQVPPADPMVEKALRYLEGFLTDKGGLSEVPHANYATAVALIAFKYANVNGRYDRTIQSGQEFLKRMQWDESEGKPREDVFYGGAGYGGNNSRPDLSNTAFFLDALHDTGLPANDPALQKALVFVSRCQNLKSEFNDQPWAGKINDGGFIYTAAQGGVSVAGKDDAGGLRSYASMTYAGLKSMIYAGLTKDDPRVKAATEFIARHYSVEENPGLGQGGLYYYYHTFAKTMAALGSPTFTDAAGVSHDWKAELTSALAKRQQPDGSWINKTDRFLEGDPNLVTAYAILALAYTRAAAKA